MVPVMSRQSRIDITGALHHIIARGIERRKLFDDNQDRGVIMGKQEQSWQHRSVKSEESEEESEEGHILKVKYWI